jgi:heptosyltransferase-3
MRRLLIRPGAIGDCILCFPALQHLAASYTEVWVPSAVVPLVQFADRVVSLSATGIDLVGVGDLEAPDDFKKRLQSFDSIVSWYGANREEFQSAIRELGVPCTFHRALPPESDARHATDFFCAQVGAPPGLLPRISVRPACRRRTIVIHPFSGSTRKNWPLNFFRELASRLPCTVEWTAGPEEALPEATRFENLSELASWIAGADLYIGNDSGITHLAAATGVKTLALFQVTDPAKWAPRGPNVVVLEKPSVASALSAAKQLLGTS